MARNDALETVLNRLTVVNGVGCSTTIADAVLRELALIPIKASIESDGSVTAIIKGEREPGVMITCHLDEVGLMVSSVDREGRLRFSTVGKIDERILPGQEVIVHGTKDVKGYIGAKPPHLMTDGERKKVISTETLFVDTGLPAEQVKQYVRVGDCISFNAVYARLQNELRAVKSLDNRASVACGILALRELAKVHLHRSIYFVATSQEEYTGLGARIHAYKLPVDCAVVIDVTFGEHPDTPEHECFPLNGGPAIGRGATIPDRLFEQLVETANELKIPYSVEPMPVRTGTDADTIAFSREGIPTCVISIPVRYMHTPVEVVSLEDIEYTKRLVVGFMRTIDGKPCAVH